MGLSERQREIAEAREQFAEGRQIPSWVRPQTARSWRRCALAGLHPDAEIRPRFAGEVDDNNVLLRAARPIAEDLTLQFADAGVAMLLADRDGRLVGRWAAGVLLDQLDGISARPGFVFDEATVGTSALGTALEDALPAIVLGTEHFMRRLEGLCAAGAPIRHPATGRIEGSMDIVCPTGTPQTFMLPLITRAIRDVEDRLVNGHSAADRALLDGFLQTDRRGPRRPMLAVNSRLLLANTLVGDLLDGNTGRHVTLWEQVRRAIADGDSTIVLDADSPGGPVHGAVRELRAPDGSIGAVVQLRRATAGDPISRRTLVRGHDTNLMSIRVPGASELWRGVLRRTVEPLETAGRLLLVGMPGVGKSTLAAALLDLHGREPAAACCDARDMHSEGVQPWLSRAETVWSEAGAVILSHLEQLERDNLEMVCRWLDGLPAASRPVLATYRSTDLEDAPSTQLVTQFEHIVDVPSLDARREDIPVIVENILADDAGLAVRVEPAAMRQLMGRDWPGNIRQLRRVVLAARHHSSGRTIRELDIPQPFRGGAARKTLTRLERVERDAIAAVLAASHGNKRTAAAELGISRSTLYRKIEALGLDHY
jgi:transcriptional regulator of acetoin/glycerol metabolism